MTDATEAARIAASLTEAQRAAVLILGTPESTWPADLVRAIDGADASELRALDQHLWRQKRWELGQELTPLGLAVRAHLLGETA